MLMTKRVETLKHESNFELKNSKKIFNKKMIRLAIKLTIFLSFCQLIALFFYTSVDAQEDFEDYLDYPDYPADQVQPSTTSWSYQDQQSWGFHWPECRSGRQSPVDIDTSLVASTPYLNLRFSRFNKPLFGYSVRAEDRAIRLRAAFKGPGPGITGTALRWVPYQLGAMSWHWGGHRGAGSEHSFNYVQYDGELQLHFYSKKYGSLEVASLAPGSEGDNPRTSLPQPVAILSVLFKEANEPNPRLEQLLEAIQVWARLTNHSSSSSSNLEPFSSLEVPISEPIVLADLFPLSDPVTDQWKVFTYRGSLSTPPCSEVVQYFVLAEVNAIGSEQLSVFRSLRDPATGLSLGNNYRQTQPLNGRQISYF